MPQYAPPAYLADYVGLSSTNQATDYNRMREEIEKQKRELEEEKRKRGSFGARMLRGVGGAIPAAAMGFMVGGPVGAGIGAGAGFAGGALNDGSGQQNAGTMISQSIPLAAMAASKGGSYLSNSGGQGFSSADVANEYGMGNLTPEDLRMLRAQGRI
jgi:hypothetical protein